MATNTCPRCKRTFRVLDDESGDHAFPFCGWEPTSEDDYEDDTDFGEEE